MKNKRIDTELFDILVPMFSEYSGLFEVTIDQADTYCLTKPDGKLFAALQIRSDSVAFFIDCDPGELVSGLPERSYRRVDKNGWYYLTLVSVFHQNAIKDLLKLAYTGNTPASTGTTSAPAEKNMV